MKEIQEQQFQNKSKDRDYSLDLLRCVACFAIVICHVICRYYGAAAPVMMPIDSSILESGILKMGSVSWQVSSFIDALSRFSVPVFVMISGSLILARKELTMKYISKKVFRLVIFMVLWGGYFKAEALFTNCLFHMQMFLGKI